MDWDKNSLISEIKGARAEKKKKQNTQVMEKQSFSTSHQKTNS